MTTNTSKVLNETKQRKANKLAPEFMAEGKTYRYWRLRIMYSIMLGYAFFYIVRANFTPIMPELANSEDFLISELGVGFILTVFSVVYGLGKFFNGFLSDRFNARYFMAIGLAGAGVINLFAGFAPNPVILALLWGLNAWFQSMGWPPCARLLTHWFTPVELGRRWGIWNMSHQIGTILTTVVCALIIEQSTLGWRYAFYIPGVIALVGAYFLYNRLRDTPQSLGMSSVEKFKGMIHKDEEDGESNNLTLKEIVFDHILPNRRILKISVATLFLYVVKNGLHFWVPLIFVKEHNASLLVACLMLVIMDLPAMVGGVTAGWLSDRLFKGHRGAVATIFMLGLAVSIVVFKYLGIDFKNVDGTLSIEYAMAASCMVVMGFFMAGAQVLSGVAAADFSSKKVAGAATGLTGTFGYVGSGIISGIGVGAIAKKYGWDMCYDLFTICSLLSAFFFFLTAKHRSSVLDKAAAAK